MSEFLRKPFLEMYLVLHKNFFINGYFNKCDQIRSFLWIWSHLLKKSLMENFIFCAVYTPVNYVFLLKSRLLILCCFCVLVNKHFANLTGK